MPSIKERFKAMEADNSWLVCPGCFFVTKTRCYSKTTDDFICPQCWSVGMVEEHWLVAELWRRSLETKRLTELQEIINNAETRRIQEEGGD